MTRMNVGKVDKRQTIHKPIHTRQMTLKALQQQRGAKKPQGPNARKPWLH